MNDYVLLSLHSIRGGGSSSVLTRVELPDTWRETQEPQMKYAFKVSLPLPCGSESDLPLTLANLVLWRPFRTHRLLFRRCKIQIFSPRAYQVQRHPQLTLVRESGSEGRTMMFRLYIESYRYVSHNPNILYPRTAYWHRCSGNG